MFLKAPLLCSTLLVMTAIALGGCARALMETTETKDDRLLPALDNNTAVEGQQLPPRGLHSLQLYTDRPGQAPIIELNSGQTLTLKFDELGMGNRLFRIRITHHNADWSSSQLLPAFYLRGFQEDIITDSSPSNVQRPAYTHYSYRFPNENIQLQQSGNYMIWVYSYERDDLLFSLPFFVHENAGQIQTEIEELYGLDRRYLKHNQLFATYKYPDFVIIPDADLETRFVQNHFWGRARIADVIDISRVGEIRSHITRDQVFAGRFEFRQLDLRRLQQDVNILEYRAETIPPQILLRQDVVNLDVTPGMTDSHRFGIPRDDLNARYAEVHFELQLPHTEATDLPVYVIGPFNNWSIHEDNRMNYDPETDSYFGRALMKEGIYDYKYAVIDEYGRVDDLRLDASFADSRQLYHTFIYYRDPEIQADRLLKVQRSETR